MKKISLISCTLLALSVHAAVQAQEHRLAFSKAQQVEVFVDQAEGAAWCQEELALRFAFDLEQANLSAVESLLPKLGVLFGQQCPAAEKVTWQALNKNKDVQASGTASKQTAWLMNQERTEKIEQLAATVETTEVVAAAAVEQASTTTESVIAASAQEVAAPSKPVAEQTAAAKDIPVQDQTVTETEQLAAATVAQSALATEPASAVAADNAVEAAAAPTAEVQQASAVQKKSEAEVEQAVAATAEAVAVAEKPAEKTAATAKLAAETKATAEPEPEAVAAVEAKPESSTVFSVNGWQPKQLSAVLAQHQALRVITDQQGCKAFIRNDIDLGQQAFTVTSSGASCENGYLSGQGSVAITRSDGAQLGEFAGMFKNGLPFSHDLNLPVVDMDESGNAYLLLQQDTANQSYYLLQAQKASSTSWFDRSANISFWNIDAGNVYLLTDKKDAFRQADSIELAVLAPVANLAKSFADSKRYRLIAVTDFTEGIVNRYGSHWLYDVQVAQDRRNAAQWTYDPNRAKNYLFENEARAAREAQRIAEQQAREAQRKAQREAYERRLELDRIARQASRELDVYARLREDSRNPAELMASKLTDVSYSKVGYSRYASLLKGGEANFAQVVNIKNDKQGMFWADYPYNLAIDGLAAEVNLGKGWYLVGGQQKIDPAQQDDQGLPLTVVYPDYAFACEEKGCTDFFTPLNLARLEFNKPDWTPEQAEQQIADAQKVQE